MNMHLSERGHQDKIFGDTLQTTINMQMSLQQTIIHMNLECSSRLILQLGQFQNVYDVLQGLEEIKAIEATQETIEALKGKKSVRGEMIRKIYANLAKEYGHEDSTNKYIKMLSDSALETPSPGQVEEELQLIEIEKQEEASQLKVIQANYLSKVFKISLKIESIEFWLSDYDDLNNVKSIGQIMKFKFRSLIDYNANNIVQNVLCK